MGAWEPARGQGLEKGAAWRSQDETAVGSWKERERDQLAQALITPVLG